MSTVTLLLTPPKSPVMRPREPSVGCSYSNVVDDRNVRFDEECILIPPPAKKPAIVTVSYSLPLWRRRAGDIAENESEGSEVTFKVPVPRFMSRSRSSQSPRESPDTRILAPCLVQRKMALQSSASQPRTPQKPARRNSITVSPSSPRFDVATVPLRSCCANCIPTVDDCINLGDEWTEKFSKAARKRRSSSVDSSSKPAFLAVDLDKLDQAPLVTEDDLQQQAAEKEAEEACTKPALRLGIEALVISPCIKEEDDDQLFPLPSPRRTPNTSPAGSPNASTSNVSVAAPRTVSPHPGGSRDSLPFPPTCAPRLQREPSADSVDGDGFVLVRDAGQGRCTKGLLTPDPSPAKSAPVPVPMPASRSAASGSKPTRGVSRSRSVDAAGVRVSESILPPSLSRSRVQSSTDTEPERSREKTPKSEKRRSARFSGQQLWKVGADVLKGVSMSPPMSV